MRFLLLVLVLDDVAAAGTDVAYTTFSNITIVASTYNIGIVDVIFAVKVVSLAFSTSNLACTVIVFAGAERTLM